MGGFLPVPGQSIYGASKLGVKLLTEAMYTELKGTNVHVSVVIPGGIATDIIKNSDLDVEIDDLGAGGVNLILTPKKAARVIISCMEKNKFRVFVDKDVNVMNIIYKFAPKLAIKLMTKMLELQ